LFWKTDLEELHLLMFAENKFGGFPPVGCMFPAVLDEARRMAVNL
jgi:hypothetical protein